LQQDEQTRSPDAATPERGTGAGRHDVTGRTNVYPATDPYPLPGDKVDVKTPGEFVDDGSRETGPQPSGDSEIIPPAGPPRREA
jgi:hypothetical protein